jgi:hypothetical protein
MMAMTQREREFAAALLTRQHSTEIEKSVVVKAIVKLYKQVPPGQREGLTHLAHELGLLEQCKAALK